MLTRAIGVALICTLIARGGTGSPEVHVLVVVNSANPVTSMPRERVAKIFLREIGEWENGTEILPVDQIDKSPARIAFARDVHNQSVASLKRYWQERIFSGSESPPPDRVTDADVLTYVRSNPGAIGYILEGSDPGTGVHVVTLTVPTRAPTAVSTHS